MNKIIKNPLFKNGFFQALGVVLYCSLIGVLFWKGNQIFGNTPNYFGPVAFLLLFSFSALTCGLLVFYKPYKLFFDGKRKDAADLVIYTTAWIFIFLVLFLSVVVLT